MECAAGWRARTVVLPTIGAAIAAGLPWLSFSCPACGQSGNIQKSNSTISDARHQAALAKGAKEVSGDAIVYKRELIVLPRIGWVLKEQKMVLIGPKRRVRA